MAGYGDELMRTGLARGAKERGKRIAFGDRRSIMWGPYSAEIFRDNPNIAPPGSERHDDIEWIEQYKGHRLYMKSGGPGFIWNMEHRAIPGEVYFSAAERRAVANIPPGFVVIEPNVPGQKLCALNKTWPIDRYAAVARELRAAGYRIIQFGYKGAKHRLVDVTYINTGSFRHALSILARAKLAIVPEGGLHHGAAAVGIPAIVLFGGFIPPQVTGYDTHINLTGGATACGSLRTCQHCRDAMRAISVDHVCQEAMRILNV